MKDPQDIHIVCILQDPGETFWALCGQGMQDQAHQHGINLAFRPVLNWAETQVEVEDCLRQPHLDALILVGTTYSHPNHGGAAVVPPIPIINCNAALYGTVVACELQPDLHRAAVLAVSYLAEQLQGRGKIVHIHGPTHHLTATLPRSQGFAATMAQHPGMRVAFEAAGQWDQASAAEAMRAALAADPDVQGVFAHSDAMALGALEVLEAAGRHDVLVVSVDALPQALTAIHAGRLAATVDTSPYTLGRMALIHALQILQGQTPPASVLTDVRLITRENLFDPMLATVRVFPNVLRDLVAGNQAQRRLQEERTAELSAINAALAHAAQLKDEFLASMSHELRTPLNAILGLAEALEEQIYGPLTTHQISTVQQIAASGQHLLALINDILDLSKVEAGKLELEMSDVDIAQLCQTSLQFVMAAATKKRMRVVRHIDSAVLTVQADARRLKQILVNLLSNAVKFTPEGGSIGLEVEGDRTQQEVHFTVWDTGIGITKADMPRLFQPFVQLDSRLARAHAGTGLGLALVRRLTDLHGGSVALDSQVGVGSRFTITLPWRPAVIESARRGDTPATTSGAEPPPLTRRRLVLIVEDNPANLTTVADYLAFKGYQVIAARDGEEAIARAQETQPDVLLMDIQMPGMDGVEATRRIREIPVLRTTPIIATTALAMPGDRERCLAAGATAYLTKPLRLKELVTTIEQLLDHH